MQPPNPYFHYPWHGTTGSMQFVPGSESAFHLASGSGHTDSQFRIHASKNFALDVRTSKFDLK
jgi:hypothetical protein